MGHARIGNREYIAGRWYAVQLAEAAELEREGLESSAGLDRWLGRLARALARSGGSKCPRAVAAVMEEEARRSGLSVSVRL